MSKCTMQHVVYVLFSITKVNSVQAHKFTSVFEKIDIAQKKL